jgi:hypothetical protein
LIGRDFDFLEESFSGRMEFEKSPLIARSGISYERKRGSDEMGEY